MSAGAGGASSPLSLLQPLRRTKLAAFLDEAETDACIYDIPGRAPGQLHTPNTLERVIGEIKSRTEVVDIFPNVDAIVRLIRAILLEQNDE